MLLSPLNISPLGNRSLSIPDKSFKFNGTNQVLVADSLVTDLKATTIGSVCFWYKSILSVPASSQILFSLGDTNANELFYIAHLNTGKIGVLALKGGVGQYNMQTTNAVLGDNSWNLICARQNGTSINISINGINVAQATTGAVNDLTAWFNDLTGLDNARFGAVNYNSGGNVLFCDGNIADFQAYSTYLSDANLLDIHNKGIPKDETARTGLISYYKFNNLLNNYNNEVANEWKIYDSKGSNDIQSLNMTLASLTTSFPPSFGVYIAGQSNALGWEDMANLQVGYQGTNTNVKMWTGSAYNTINSATNNNQFPVAYKNNKFGAEFSLGYKLATYLGKDVNILKYAKGASKLAADGSALDWSTSTNELYLDFKNAITASGNVRFKSVLWIQGEQDCLLLADANAYEANLTSFINGIRTHVGYDIHFTIVLVNSNSTTLTYRTTVRAAQLSVAATLTNISTIDADSFSLQVDNVHYDASGYDSIGDATFNIIKNF